MPFGCKARSLDLRTLGRSLAKARLWLHPGDCFSNRRGFSYKTNVRTKVDEVKPIRLPFWNFVRTVIGMEKRMGRPPKSGDKAMIDRLEIRIEAAEKAAYDEAARSAGMDRSDWIRHVLNAAAKRGLKKRPSPP